MQSMAGRFSAAIDGGSRGNPGPAAWGVAVLDDHGACIEEHAGLLGRATNNVAEYHALIQALELAQARRADEVVIQADAELIVRQIEGTYRVRHPDDPWTGTFGAFRGDSAGVKIDYILARGGWTVRAADILRRRSGSRDPSDHFPVTARLELPR